MARYHLNPDTNRVNICSASVKECKFKLSAKEHITAKNLEEAKRNYEEIEVKKQKYFKTYKKESPKMTYLKLTRKDLEKKSINELADITYNINSIRKSKIQEISELEKNLNKVNQKIVDKVILNEEISAEIEEQSSLKKLISEEKKLLKLYIKQHNLTSELHYKAVSEEVVDTYKPSSGGCGSSC